MNLRALLCTLAACLSLLTPAARAVTCAASLSPSNPDAAYTDNADGTVTHLPTGLIWKRCSEGQSWTGSTCSGTAGYSSWAQALAQARTSFAGHSDWRLPNIRELRSLVEECRASPAINDTIFPATPSSDFWSGSPLFGPAGYAWLVNFGNGGAGFDPRNYGGHAVRLVRGGQSFESLGAGDDITPPRLFEVGLSGIGQTSLTLSATCNEAATGYWLVVWAGFQTPSAAQVKAGISYRGATVLASGSGAMTANVPTNFLVSGLNAYTNYDFYVVAQDASGNLGTAPSTQWPRIPPPPANRFINLSTRGQVLTGDNVMIGGFIIQGSASKTVLIRAGGPSMANSIPGVLQNPKLDLYSGQTVIASNDDWGTSSNAAAITASTLAPSNPLESAILTTLAPGAYTAIVSGVGGTSGVGIIEVLEVDRVENQLINLSTRGQLINLSTRGQVLTGDNVMIGGFIIQGYASKTVLIRAGGPSMANSIPGVLQNPKLDLYSGQTVIASNDDWGTSSNAAAITASGLAPASALESAILTTLAPGAYTVIVSGADGGTGVGIVEVFAQ